MCKYSAFYCLIPLLFFASNVVAPSTSSRSAASKGQHGENSQQKWGVMSSRLREQSNGFVEYVKGSNYHFATVRAANPIDTGSNSYFEVTINKNFDRKIMKTTIGVGLCTGMFPLDNKLVGNYKGSVGIRSTDGLYGDGRGFGFLKPLCASSEDGFRTGDTIGCKMYLSSDGRKMVYFSKNGQPGEHVPLPSEYDDMPLYPCVSLEKVGTKITGNFGPVLNIHSEN